MHRNGGLPGLQLVQSQPAEGALLFARQHAGLLIPGHREDRLLPEVGPHRLHDLPAEAYMILHAVLPYHVAYVYLYIYRFMYLHIYMNTSVCVYTSIRLYVRVIFSKYIEIFLYHITIWTI